MIDTWSEAWRRECEARHLLTIPLKERRRLLEEIGKVRGKKALEQLKQDILIEWQKKSPKD